jgi:hypothetical protein
VSCALVRNATCPVVITPRSAVAARSDRPRQTETTNH